MLVSSPKYYKAKDRKVNQNEKKKFHPIVSASVIWWKLQKLSFQGALAEKMIL